MMVRHLLLGIALIMLANTVSAQNYPSRPIRFVIPYPPGGGTDTVARLLNPAAIEQLGVQIVIDNRGGANAIIGTDIGAKASPDGYTMLFCLQASMVVNPILYKKIPYNPKRDFTPVIHLDTVALMIAVHPSVPATTVNELIKLAKEKPGQINFSSSGHGSAAHLAVELMNSMAKVKMVHVPFKGGGPAVRAVIAGQVHLSMGTMISELPHVKAGRLKAIAVSTRNRITSLPDVPTIGETLSGYEAGVWHGIVVPKGTPAAVVRRLNQAFNNVLKMPEIQSKLRNNGVEPVGGTPEQFASLIKADEIKHVNLLREVGLVGSL
jgi:tripartite-type tricarboxylate transporter receptor subunit TctC